MIQKTNITLILTHTKQTRNVSSFMKIHDQPAITWLAKNDHMNHVTRDERSRDIVLAEKSSI